MITFIARFHIVFDATLMLASFAANTKSNPVKTADTAVSDPGEGPGGTGPPCFYTKLRPKGPKKFFGDPPPPYFRVGVTGPPTLSQGLDPA